MPASPPPPPPPPLPPLPPPSPPPASAALIVGCGYLGRRLAPRLMEPPHAQRVYATTRSPDRARQLAALGVKPLLVQVTQPLTLAALTPALDEPALDVYYMVPPGRQDQRPTPRQVVLGGVAHMTRALARGRVRRAILVSSTAVYGYADGRRVDADTPARPTDNRSRIILEGDGLFLAAGDRYHVVRLAGLYGPGRIIGLRPVMQGAPLLGDPQALLNLIHVDDAADLLLAISQAAAPGRVEIGCDNHAIPRKQYYDDLARRLKREPPEVLDADAAAARFGLDVERLRRTTSKALDNKLTRERTGWSPRYASYHEGLAHALANSGPNRNPTR
ncbi:MAG: NAD-dependent epimerase/dehydratase family protein [Phycisphaeraceae bacterium]